MLDTVQDGIEQVYRAKAKDGTTDEMIHDAVEAETWYTAAEAAEMFDITVEDTAVQLVACSKGLGFKDMPEAVKAAKTATEEEKPTDNTDERIRRLQVELELLK